MGSLAPEPDAEVKYIGQLTVLNAHKLNVYRNSLTLIVFKDVDSMYQIEARRDSLTESERFFISSKDRDPYKLFNKIKIDAMVDFLASQKDNEVLLPNKEERAMVVAMDSSHFMDYRKSERQTDFPKTNEGREL